MTTVNQLPAHIETPSSNTNLGRIFSQLTYTIKVKVTFQVFGINESDFVEKFHAQSRALFQT